MSRRLVRRLLLAGATVLSIGLAAPVASADPAAGVREDADRIMNLTAAEFVAHEKVAPFDWSTDGCTAATTPDYGEFFRIACMQHDFGYGNYGNQGALKLSPVEETKAWIDERFWHEMRRLCLEPGGPDEGLCLFNAGLMYDGVVLFGGAYFY